MRKRTTRVSSTPPRPEASPPVVHLAELEPGRLLFLAAGPGRAELLDLLADQVEHRLGFGLIIARGNVEDLAGLPLCAACLAGSCSTMQTELQLARRAAKRIETRRA